MPTKIIKDVIKELFQKKLYKEINVHVHIQKIWKKTFGEPINNNTKIKSYKRGVLTIITSNPIWRNELSLQKKEIINKLKSSEPNLKIKEIFLSSKVRRTPVTLHHYT